MADKQLGKATYRAVRSGVLTTLIAAGETPNFNDTMHFEMLPFRIFPPMYAFYFIHADIGLPTIRPFVYEQSITFPPKSPSIRIQDADGLHDVAIEEIKSAPELTEPQPAEGNFCVFSWAAADQLMLTAKCDAILPAVYSKISGPNTYAECQQYIKDHQGGGV
jgi:hypothetical protein